MKRRPCWKETRTRKGKRIGGTYGDGIKRRRWRRNEAMVCACMEEEEEELRIK